MELAASIGISMSEFWQMTPHELNICAKSYEKKRIEEQKESMYHAYLISRWVWKERINIQKELGKIGKKKKVMTDDEMLEQVMKLNKLFGGEVKGYGQ